MSLNNLAAVVSFLLLLAPGIVWELQRSRHKPSIKQSALVEISRIVLVSLGATLVSAVVIVPFVWLPAVDGRWDLGSLTTERFADLSTYMLATVIHAIAACALTGWFSHRRYKDQGTVASEPTLHLALATWQEPNGVEPRLIIELNDGTIWRGRRRAFDTSAGDTGLWIALGPPLRRKRAGEIFTPISEKIGAVILRSSEVRSIQIAYGNPPVPQPESSVQIGESSQSWAPLRWITSRGSTLRHGLGSITSIYKPKKEDKTDWGRIGMLP